MPIVNKTKNTAAIYNRGREVVKVYDHGTLAWQKQSSIPDYLCFTALESGTFTLTIPAAVTSAYLSYVEYSLDGQNWTRLTVDSTAQSITAGTAQNPIPAGGKVYWRGSGSALGPSFTEGGRCIFSSSANFDASGHLMSLLVGDNFANYEHLTHFNTDGIRNATFSYLFKGCNTLVNAKDLVLPTFESYHLYIYYYTFRECSSLVSQPPLLSTNLAQACYYGMYYGCTSLTASATLPAATLQESCYRYMYYNCTNLETVNPILATTASGTNCMNQMFRICKKITRAELHLTGALTQACCYQMFQLCSALSYVKCLATDISATNCVTNWLASASSTGTFIQAAGATWPRGASGIPTGWVDIEKRTMPSGYKQVEYVANPNYGYINIGRAFDSNEEKLELAFVKQGSGSSMPFGNSTYNYRYGQLKVIDQSTALTIRAGVDYDDQVYKQSQITSVTDDKPHTLQYVGSSSGFQLYLDGTLKKTETCAWDAVNPFDGNMLFTASTNTSSTAYFHIKPIFYVKMWDGTDNLALDYVAAIRESDNVAGFYDLVGGVFHPSDNANNFTAGQEI